MYVCVCVCVHHVCCVCVCLKGMGEGMYDCMCYLIIHTSVCSRMAYRCKVMPCCSSIFGQHLHGS